MPASTAYGACADDGRVEGRGVLLEEAAVDDRAVDVEPRILRVAALELVRADDAAGPRPWIFSGFHTSTFSL